MKKIAIKHARELIDHLVWDRYKQAKIAIGEIAKHIDLSSVVRDVVRVNCLACGKALLGYKEGSKYCDDACRMAFSRGERPKFNKRPYCPHCKKPLSL